MRSNPWGSLALEAFSCWRKSERNEMTNSYCNKHNSSFEKKGKRTNSSAAASDPHHWMTSSSLSFSSSRPLNPPRLPPGTSLPARINPISPTVSHLQYLKHKLHVIPLFSEAHMLICSLHEVGQSAISPSDLWIQYPGYLLGVFILLVSFHWFASGLLQYVRSLSSSILVYWNERSWFLQLSG